MRRWLLLLGGGLIALLLIIAGASVLTTKLQERHEKQTTVSFINKVLADNAQASYTMFSSSAQKAQSEDQWAATVQKLSKFFKGKSPQFQTLTTTKTTVIAHYAITGNDGNYIMIVTLTKTKAGWQVLNFTSRLQTS